MSTVHIKHQHPERIWQVLSGFLFLTTVGFMFVAVHNAKPLQCDDIIYDQNSGKHVCEVNL